MATFEPATITSKAGREIVIRSLVPEDAAAHLKFREQVPYDSTHTMQYIGMTLPTVDEIAERIRLQLADPISLNPAAFDGQKVVGYLNFRLPDPQHPWTRHVGQFGMMVLKEYWGQGIGQKLLELQDLHAQKNQVTRIEAMVRTKNERGIKLYERNGFEIEGTRRRAAKIDGEWQDEFFIAKLFNNKPLSWTPPTLHTPRLVLRPLALNDADSIYAYAKEPNVSQFTLWEPHTSVDESRIFIKNYVFDHYARGVPEPFGIALQENPEKIIGTVGCFWTSKSSKAMELGYALAEEHWGKGIATEASQAALNFCLDHFSLKRIQARCKAENLKSRRVLEKIGMTFEGTLKSSLFHRGRYWDIDYLAKVRD